MCHHYVTLPFSIPIDASSGGTSALKLVDGPVDDGQTGNGYKAQHTRGLNRLEKYIRS